MNGFTIDKILRRHKDTMPYFKGVFSSNACPDKIERGSCYIINTDPMPYPGRHWVCIYAPLEHGPVDYYDSYGRPPTTIPGIAKFLRTQNVVHNTRQIQSLYSDVCGHHCIYFLIERCKGRSMKDIVDRFTDDPRRNDKYVSRIIKNI